MQSCVPWVGTGTYSERSRRGSGVYRNTRSGGSADVSGCSATMVFEMRYLQAQMAGQGVLARADGRTVTTSHSRLLRSGVSRFENTKLLRLYLASIDSSKNATSTSVLHDTETKAVAHCTTGGTRLFPTLHLAVFYRR